MYLLIYNSIPEDISYYLLPDEIAAQYIDDFTNVASVVINGDDVSDEQSESYNKLDILVAEWKQYQVEIASVLTTQVNGIFTMRYIL
jgi:hypothetical protein